MKEWSLSSILGETEERDNEREIPWEWSKPLRKYSVIEMEQRKLEAKRRLALYAIQRKSAQEREGCKTTDPPVTGVGQPSERSTETHPNPLGYEQDSKA